ncbi:MAG: hypothetical protein WCF18_20810 [Chthoniobacteraceae bacterium]
MVRLVEWTKREGGGVSINDASERLELSRIRIAQLTAAGTLVWTKFESIVIISRRSLEEYAEIKAQRGDRRPGSGRPRRLSPVDARWALPFLEALERGRTISEAVRMAQVTRQTAYKLRARDERFAAAWDAALLQGRDRHSRRSRPGRRPAIKED